MFNKKIKSLVLGGMLSSCMVIPTMALDNTVPIVLNVEPMVLDVTVPSTLTINVDNRGVVTTATTGKVVNNSRGAILVKNVGIVPKDGWSLVNFDTDFSSESVGVKKIGFKLNDKATQSDGSFTWTEAKINGVKDGTASELPLTYDAKVPAQANALSGLNVLDVVFTVGWYE